MIAEKILFPGRYSRLDNLAMHGRLAAQMAAGAVLMLFVAAILEGGFRQLVQSTPLRFAIGVGVGHRLARLFQLLRPERGDDARATSAPRSFFEGTLRTRRQIVTPEGVPVPVEIADYGERLVAFVVDLCIWLVATLRDLCSDRLVDRRGRRRLMAVSIALFIGFLFRNLYFVYFELAWRGSTPGKRMVGLRVIDRHGGPLVPSAVIARNLTREVEMFMPLGVLLTSGQAAAGAADWENLAIARLARCCSPRCRSSTATACAAAT